MLYTTFHPCPTKREIEEAREMLRRQVVAIRRQIDKVGRLRDKFDVERERALDGGPSISIRVTHRESGINFHVVVDPDGAAWRAEQIVDVWESGKREKTDPRDCCLVGKGEPCPGCGWKVTCPLHGRDQHAGPH